MTNKVTVHNHGPYDPKPIDIVSPDRAMALEFIEGNDLFYQMPFTHTYAPSGYFRIDESIYKTILAALQKPDDSDLVKALKWSRDNAEIALEFPDDAEKYMNKTIGVVDAVLAKHKAKV